MADTENWRTADETRSADEYYLRHSALNGATSAPEFGPRRASALSVPTKPKNAGKPGRAMHSAFVGSSAAMKALRDEIAIFAVEEEAVLICGETGAGKEMVARELHRLSARKDNPFIVRNVSGVSSELAGSEFFGHVKGAFTSAVDKHDGIFTLADGGTLHLDEIGDLSLDAQSQILRVVEDGAVMPVGGVRARNVDTRVIAATNINLAHAVEQKKFREDLYHRLNVLRINVPPLRERGDDIIEIAEHWLKDRGAHSGKTSKLASAAADKLLDYSWPGNVRELKNTVIRASILARNKEIEPRHIRIDTEQQSSLARGISLNVSECRKLTARYLVAKALDKAGGNATKAAEMTGLGRSTFMTIKKKLKEDDASTASLAADLRAVLGIYQP